MWIASRPDYAPLLLEIRQTRAAFLAQGLRTAGRSARSGMAALTRGVGHAVSGAVKALGRWRRRTATQRELGRLSDRELNDIGLSRDLIGTIARDLAGQAPDERISKGNVRPMQVERSTVAEDSFAQTAHNLRTPLTVIRSLTEIVRDNPHLAPTKRQQLLGKVVQESKRLNRAIDTVLNDRKAA